MRKGIFFGSVAMMLVLTLILFGATIGMMSQGVMPVLAHPLTPEADDDLDGVSNDLDSCSMIPGETWNNGCPYTPPAPPTEAYVPPTPIPVTATPNPITVWNFTASERDALSAASADSPIGTVTTTRSLSQVGLQPNAAVAELHGLGMVAAGGRIGLQIGYLFTNGFGNLFLTLGASSPSTDEVISGQITFTSYDTNVLELCSLASRVTRDGSRNATTYISIGLTNRGQVFVIDRADAAAAATLAVANVNLNLSQPHEITATVVGSTVNVFVDGTLVLADVPVTSRSGVHGQASVGAAASSPRCEVRNFWTYMWS